MQNKRIEILFEKYMKNQLNSVELDEFFSLLNSGDHQDLFNEYLSLKKPMLSPCMNTTYGIIGRLSKAHLWVVCALGIDLISEDQTQRLRFKNLESFIEKVNQLSLKSLQNENLSIAKYPYANQKIKGEIKKKLRDHIQFQVVRPPRLKWTLFQRQIQQIINRSNHLCKVGAENKSMAKI